MPERTIPTPLEAIHQHCYHCCALNWKEVPKCAIPTCALWPFRFGKDPGRQGVGRKGGNPNLNK